MFQAVIFTIVAFLFFLMSILSVPLLGVMSILSVLLLGLEKNVTCLSPLQMLPGSLNRILVFKYDCALFTLFRFPQGGAGGGGSRDPGGDKCPDGVPDIQRTS